MTTVDARVGLSSVGVASWVYGFARVGTRIFLLLAWTLGCRTVLFLANAAEWFARATGGTFASRFRPARTVARAWVRGIRTIIGLRLVVHGAAPEPPYFIVTNHMAWHDFYGIFSALDVRGIVEEPVRRVPVLGALMTALDPIYVRRVKEDTARVKALMVEAIRQGHSVVMAPETPETTIRRGTGVRQFRGGLLEAAVIAEKPVHYMSVTYRTPNGCMPPSKALIFGPNPFLPTLDGKIPESEYRMYERQTFLQHLTKLLSLPYFEFVITFGPEPIFDSDRIQLANRLHEAVAAIFNPIE